MTGPTDVRIRTATGADRAGVVSCVNAAYEQYIAAIGKKPAPMLADYTRLIDDGFVETHRVDEDGYRRVYFSRRVP